MILTREPTRRRVAQTLDDVFDPRHNALNALRLLMAVTVVVWHSFPLTSTPIAFEPARQLLSRLPVDVFFTVSGFLIVSSWARRPDVVSYLRARVLRIFPAFWVCLIVTAAVLAPLTLLIRGVPAPAGFVGQAVSYVLKNAGLRVWQYGIAGTPEGIPYGGQWNGALWTLCWEFGCYLAVLAIGVAGLLRRRATIPLLYLLCTVGVIATAYGPVSNWYVSNGSRFGIMFAGGALVWRFRASIPVRGRLIALAAVIVAALAFLPDYGVLAAVPLAYIALSVGALLKQPRLTLTNDISYGVYIYGFPLQQVISTISAGRLDMPLFALVSLIVTLPVATLSWVVIERPALRLKGRRQAPPTDPVATAV